MVLLDFGNIEFVPKHELWDLYEFCKQQAKSSLQNSDVELCLTWIKNAAYLKTVIEGKNDTN